MGDSSDSDGDSSHEGVQVRVVLSLAPDCTDRSLAVDVQAIAVPADVGRKGLSAVVNHLLDRKLGTTQDGEDGSDAEDDDDDDDGGDKDDRLPAIPFDFIIGGSNKLQQGSSSRRLLRTGIEKEARRSGLTLEEAIPVTYFPAQQAPEMSGQSEQLPDWIAALSFVRQDILCTGCYDGSIHVFQTKKREDDGTLLLEKVAMKPPTSDGGPIKCLSAIEESSDGRIWLAAGSMDHSLQLFRMDADTFKLSKHGDCKGGHVSAVASVDLLHSDSQKYLASGDWDGAVLVWDFGVEPVDAAEDQQPVKKTKTGKSSKSSVAINNNTQAHPTLSAKVSLQAHTSKVSGVSWGNYEKRNSRSSSEPRQLITGSWDHSLKVWDIERQDCLLTLNGSRVVSCLDTSYHSTGIVATGHPDCTVRLWDTRTADDAKESSLMLVSDKTFRPSHKEWIADVQWSRHNPYHLASTSHDGTVKLWDIRSPLPLHTVRAFGKTDKGLSLVYGESRYMFAGGTDCIVKQFHCAQAVGTQN